MYSLLSFSFCGHTSSPCDCFFAIKTGDRKIQWQQFGIALAAFTLGFIPVIPGLRFMFHTSGTHVYDEAAPKMSNLASTLVPGGIGTLIILASSTLLAALVAVVTKRRIWNNNLDAWRVFVCTSLALIPILILYSVSKSTSIHIFVGRYRLVAIAGIALCWALAISWFESRAIRLFFGIAIVAMVAQQSYSDSTYRHHGYTWKYALDVAEKNALSDQAPVLICSDLPESDYVAMPTGNVGDSAYFPSLTYYKLSTTVVPLPRSLNNDAMQIASRFLRDATAKHQRFLALAFQPSYKTLDWLALRSSGAYTVHSIGVYDGVEILEFFPRIEGAMLR